MQKSVKECTRLLRPVKEDLNLQTPDVYSIPFECRKVNTEHTGIL